MWRAAWILLLVACGGPAAPSARPVATPAAAAQTTPAAPAVPISEPAEYDVPHVSRAAGERIFAHTGIGDPYRTGMPYPIFLALLRAFPDDLGGDPATLAGKFGLIARAPVPASDDIDVREGLPIGLHLTTDPITGVAFVVGNCALCHAQEVGGHVVVGLANKRIRIHAYDRAFGAVTARRAFDADHLATLARAAADERHLTWPPAYADAFVAATVAALRRRAADRAELFARTAADPPGRVATIEAFAAMLHDRTGRTIAPARDVGWAKIPDVVGFAQRTSLSWDGAPEGPLPVLAVEQQLEEGVRDAWFQRHAFQGAALAAYLAQPAPRPAFPAAIDRARAARGKRSFEDNCAPCHGRYDEHGRVLDYDEQVVRLSDLGTDPARALAPTSSFEEAANDPALTHAFTRFRAGGGYVPPILTNVWARAPYGHAGQWPSLAVLATPPDRRAARVVYALAAPYDLAAVGVATRAASATPLGTGDYLEDGTAPGLSVLGHPFLADLGAAEARDVVEYLKTL